MKNLLDSSQILANNIDEVLNISLVNLDQITNKTLSYYFDSNLCDNVSVSSSLVTTDLYIIDCQRKFDSKLLENINNSRVFAVLLYIENCDFKDSNNIALLKKPINITALEDKISYVRNQLPQHIETNKLVLKEQETQCSQLNHRNNLHLFRAIINKKQQHLHPVSAQQKYVGVNTDVGKNNNESKEIFITVENYLFYYLQKCRCMAKTIRSNILLKHSLGNIFYNYKDRTFNHNFDDIKLKYLQSSLVKDGIELLATTTETETANKVSEDDVSFIWKSTIQASKGRIPKDVDINAIVKMKSWPNFSQLQVFEYALRIVAVWSKYRLSLYETAKFLQIPQRYVFTLYCAMSSLNHVETIDKSLVQSTYNVNETNKTSLFSRILAHMFKKNKTLF